MPTLADLQELESQTKKPTLADLQALEGGQNTSMQDSALRAVTNPDTNVLAGLTALGANGLSNLPGLKEAGSAIAAGLGSGQGDTFGERYNNLQDAQAAMRQAGRQTQPGPTTLADISGTLLGLGLGGKLATNIVPKSAKASMASYAAANPYKAGAMANGALGSLYGFANGSDPESRLSGAAINGAISSTIPLPITYASRNIIAPVAGRFASSGIGQKLSGLFNRGSGEGGPTVAGIGVLGDEVMVPEVNGRPDIFSPFKTDKVLGDSAAGMAPKEPLIPKFSTVPTSDELRSSGGGVYKNIQASGDQSSPEFASNFFTRISGKPPSTPAELVAAKSDPVKKFVGEWQSVIGKPMTAADVQLMDEALSNEIDNFSTPFGKLLKPGQKLYEAQTALREMAAGEGGTFSMTPEARKAWATSYKLADMERIAEKAQYMQQPTQSIQTSLRQLIMNKNRFKAYSPPEQAAIKKAATIGNMHDLLKTLGSRLLTVGATTAGGAMGGVPGAVVGALASHAGSSLAREGSAAIQMNKINDLSRMIAKPYMMPPPPVPPPYLSNLLGAGIGNYNGAGQ